MSLRTTCEEPNSQDGGVLIPPERSKLEGLHVWDLLVDDRRPIHTEELVGSAAAGPSMFSLSGDAVTTRQPSVALAKPSGEIEVHVLNNQLTRAGKHEVAELEALMEHLV